MMINFGLPRHFAAFSGGKLVAIALLALSFLTVAAARALQENPNSSADTARIMSLETLWIQAEAEGDIRALSQLVPDTFIYVDIDGSLSSKAQFLDTMKKDSARTTELKNESLVAQTYANTVVVNGVYREKGILGGKRFTRRGRFTDTWVKVNGAWLCVASQSTLIEK